MRLSLTAKLILGFLLLFVVIGGMSFGFMYVSARDALFSTLQEQLKDVASTTAAQVNGDVIASLKPGDEGTSQFIAIRDQLQAMRKHNPDIRYSYVMRESATHKGSAEFVVDDTYGIEAGAATIGQLYVDEENPDLQSEDNKEILSGLKGAAASSAVFTDQWGTFLSGYAPVYDSKGTAVAVLGVDMDASRVLSRQDFLTSRLVWLLAVVLLLSTLLVVYFSRTMSRDIKRITEMVKAMAERKVQAASEVKRSDELGDLAKTIKDMEVNVWTSIGDSPKF